MGLSQAIENYRNQYFLVTIPRGGVDGPGGGNVLLHTGLLACRLFRRGELSEIEKERFSIAVKSCEAQSGLYWRSPYKIGDTQTQDDYYGVAGGSYLCEPRLAQDILFHGETHSFRYNVVTPSDSTGLDAWHGRFPGLIEFYQHCAGNKQSPYAYMFLIAVTLSKTLLTKRDNSDSRIHGYIMAVCLLGPFTALIEWAFKLRFGSVGGAFKGYFPENHPLVIY